MDFSAPLGGLFVEPRAAVLAVLLQSGGPMTGRQLHSMVAPRWSLRTVQVALADLNELGIVHQQPVGRAVTHVLNPDHYAVPALRMLASPLDTLRDLVRTFVDERVARGLPEPSVWLFGSTARGEAHAKSDVDLAVVTDDEQWDEETNALADLVYDRFGKACDVLVVEPARFATGGREDDAFARTLLAEAFALVGESPWAISRSGTA